MKSYLLYSLALFLNMFPLVAQDYFEGDIAYKFAVDGEGADKLNEFMPDAYNYRIKGANLTLNTSGGLMSFMMGELKIIGEENKAYMIDHIGQIVYEIPNVHEVREIPGPKLPIIHENEMEEIQGYKTKKIRLENTTEEGERVVQFIWVTDDIKIKEIGNLLNFEENILPLHPEIEGFPLKVVTNFNGITLTLEATAVNKKAIEDFFFIIPDTYKRDSIENYMKGN